MAVPDEIPLTGGNVSAAVVRVGDTVRRPVTPATAAVDAFLRHLERRGFTGAPRALGGDDVGRQVLSWVPGRNQYEIGPLDPSGLERVGALIRELHDAGADFDPPPDARWQVAIPPDREDLVVHHDLAPWNLIVDGERMTFVDWDNCGPGSRLWDLSYAAHGFAVISADEPVDAVAARLRALVEGYGLDRAGRRELVPMLARRTRSMLELLLDGRRRGIQPWARLAEEGHAEHWGAVTDYLHAHEAHWSRALDAT